MAESLSPCAVIAPSGERAEELRKEGYTMALYVAICLLAALAVVAEHEVDHTGTVFKVIWGTTIGLAVAHWFAFRLSSRLVAAGAVRRHDAEAALAQFIGALVVAVLATVPVLVLGASSELDAVRLILAAFIALVGFAVARASGASVLRSTIYGVATLVVAAAIAIVKNVLAGH
jgi:hypothetical protein